jgi:uncharacterized protein YgiM (DUF1202 family)
MSLHSVSLMIVSPLVLTLGAVLILTPKDILRQPVLPAAETPRASQVLAAAPVRTPRIPIVEFEEPEILPATLIVAATMPGDLQQSRAPEIKGSTDRRWITARALNVRTGPAVNAGLIASLPFGTAVNVLETSGSWAHVEAEGVSGWLSANFLTTTDPAAD